MLGLERKLAPVFQPPRLAVQFKNLGKARNGSGRN